MENFVVRLAKYQKSRGHSVAILSLRGGILEQTSKSLGIETYVIQESNLIKRLLKSIHLIRKYNPEIVNGHNESSLKYISLASRLSRTKTVLTHHGLGSGTPHDPNSSLWNDIDTIVAVSDAVKNYLKNQKIKSKLELIANGIYFEPNNTTKEAIRYELEIPISQFLGIIVARIDNLKGHDTLIKAISILKNRSIPLTILIVGDGKERPSREALAMQLGLTQADVRFLGFRTDIPNLLAASDFFVLPSLTEGLPLSILEAMSHRLPVIATSVGGIPELITHQKNGYLIPTNSPEMLADMIETLAKDENIRTEFGTLSKEKVDSDYSFSKMADLYDSLYSSLVSSSGRHVSES